MLSANLKIDIDFELRHKYLGMNVFYVELPNAGGVLCGGGQERAAAAAATRVIRHVVFLVTTS